MREIKREENESILDYADRLIKNKNNYELDHIEIYEALFDTVISSNESRKRLYGVKDFVDKLKEEGFEKLTDDEVFEKLEKKKLELQKERIKLSTLRSDLNKTLREESREELLLEELKRAIPLVDKVKFDPLFKQDNDKSYMLCMGDIHYSSFFTSQNNEYSIDILHKRFEVLLAELIKTIDKEKINKLYITNLGDTIQGLLRLSDIKKSQIGLVESVIGVSRFLGDFINELSKYVEITYYHVSSANHSDIRIFNEKKSTIGENMEYLIANYIYDYLQTNERVNIIIPDKDYLEFELQGYNMVALHGHEVKNVKTILEKISMRNRKFYDYCILGHYHSSFEQTVYEGANNNMEVLVTPSIIGSDPYSDSLMVGSKSSAKLHVFEKGKGRVQCNNIILN